MSHRGPGSSRRALLTGIGAAAGGFGATGFVALVIASSCALTSPTQRTDIAILEAGEAWIQRIDGVVISQGKGGPFEIRPGPHTVDVTSMAIRPNPIYTTIYKSGLVSLCLKARGGRRYRIKTNVVNNRLQAYVIDTSTGEPPKTPCGPDESGD